MWRGETDQRRRGCTLGKCRSLESSVELSIKQFREYTARERPKLDDADVSISKLVALSSPPPPPSGSREAAQSGTKWLLKPAGTVKARRAMRKRRVGEWAVC